MSDTLARQTADVFHEQDALGRTYKSAANPAREKERLGDTWIQEALPFQGDLPTIPAIQAPLQSLPAREPLPVMPALRAYYPPERILTVTQQKNYTPLYRPKD